jgi:pSer/pThr/pTyr-binding forkhead associated (FHA) protein
MAFDKTQSKEVDLDSTDRLPILQGVSIDEDVEDDAIRMEHQANTAVIPALSGTDLRVTSTGVDLPSLAESVRSVEERIARQNADYEALNRLYEKTRDAQLAAGTRADELATQLTAAQSALAVEAHRAREMQRTVIETNAATEQIRTRVEEALRDSERAQTEARTLREALAARDNTIAQVLHSLGERDTQLSALQREHAKIVPDLESRSQASVRLESELKTARERADTLALDLKASRQSITDLTARIARGETEINSNRREIGAARAQAESYLETLRSRAWRGEYNRNLFLEWDEKMETARSSHTALSAECDRLNAATLSLNAKLAQQNETISKLTEAKAGDAAALAQRAQELDTAQRARTELVAKIGTLEAEQKRLQEELASERKRFEEELTAEQKRLREALAGRDADVSQARAQEAAETQRIHALLTAAESRHAELQQRLGELEGEAKLHEEEMAVLMAHLTEARRPIQSFQADVKRLTEELAAKSESVDQLTEENRSLRASLERTRGALEERELLIRRLERSASNSANVLGRLQTSIERLGATPAGSAGAAPTVEFTAELVRIDGDRHMSFPLGRRTRIGRAPGCELQIDSQSVSRNHAMILKGARELIVEDLNSTNGVLLNGRRVSRNLLTDGDLLTIGEIQFRCVLKPNPRGAEVTEGSTQAPGTASISGIRAAPDFAKSDAAKGEVIKGEAATPDAAAERSEASIADASSAEASAKAAAAKSEGSREPAPKDVGSKEGKKGKGEKGEGSKSEGSNKGF